MVTGPGDAQSPAEGCTIAGVVQAHQTPPRSDHRPRRGDAQAGHDHLAHAEQAKDLCGVPSTRGRMTDLALGCQSRMAEGGLVPPHWVLAPGTALGLLPSRALPSAQVNGIVARDSILPNRTKTKRREKR